MSPVALIVLGALVLVLVLLSLRRGMPSVTL